MLQENIHKEPPRRIASRWCSARETPVERFMSNTMPVTECGCWFWMRACHPDGYGVSGRTPAHRQAWMFFRGEIPKGAHVLHECDIPCCVNPDHLFLGTHADNMHDKGRKGRAPRGEGNKGSKLDAAAVRAILASPEPNKVLAARYGVRPCTIGDVRRGRTWGHVSA